MNELTIYVVDDDDALRDSLVWLLEGESMRVRAFATAEAFLAAVNPREPGAVLLDVRMPGMNGMELHDTLISRGFALPVVFITGHGDVPMAVEAVKKGAFDFIEKPFEDRKLIEVIKRAALKATSAAQEQQDKASIERRMHSLSTREREVMDLVVQGKLNKTIADVLGISIKTVEAHRARVMEKMNANSLAELVQLTLKIRGQ